MAFHFPQRNRIISGLSLAVVVVEAAAGSGSLITASCALDQGRDVMAVPGNVLSGRNRGAHALIRDGAKIVEDADDIVEELGLTALADASSAGTANSSGGKTSTDRILAVMEADQEYDLDGLSGASGIAGARLLSRLLDLELRGLLRRVGGGRFMRSM
jgi:DNA processing protein